MCLVELVLVSAKVGCSIELTRISLPIKVVLGIAVAAQVSPRLFPGRAVGEGNVVVGDVIEEMEFILLQHQAGGDGVNRCIAPALVEEAAVLVEGLKVVGVRLGPEPVQVTDLEVGPL